MRKLWKGTRDLGCKTAVNWVTKTIRRMTQRRALEQVETRIGKCEVTPQALSPIAKSRVKRDEPKGTTAIHGPLGVKYHPLDEADAVADCLYDQFTLHDLCDGNHDWRVDTRVKACSKAYKEPPANVRTNDVHK
jgi:hypothetical protein